MKVCDYCGRTLEDSALSCPYCMSSSLKKKCEICGTLYEGATCPTCVETKLQSMEIKEAEKAKMEAEKKANKGLVWKGILTFFLPLVGGYFTITPYTHKGVCIAAAAWCAFFTITCAFIQSSGGKVVKFLVFLVSAGPLIAYWFKVRGTDLVSERQFKLISAGLGALMIIGLLGCIFVPTA